MEVNVEMTYRTKSCPYCGKTYAWMETTYLHYGSPIRVCSQCKKTFVDKSYQELACIDYGTADVHKIEPISLFSVIVGILFIVLSLFKSSAPDDGGMFILFLLFVIFLFCSGCYFVKKDIISYPSRREQLECEIERSRKRLSNPEYARTLLSLGYDVPIEYLQVKNVNIERPGKSASGSSSAKCPPFKLSDSAKYAITVFIVVFVALVFLLLLNAAF